MKGYLAICFLFLCAIAHAQNAALTSTINTTAGRSLPTGPFTFDPYLVTDGLGTAAIASWQNLSSLDMRLHTISRYGAQRDVPFSFYTSGFAHGRITHIAGLPAGGFVVSGFARNASNMERPFLVYFNAAGDLVWSRLFTDVPLAAVAGPTLNHAFAGPSNSITYVAQDSVNQLIYAYRFRLDGTQIGIRGTVMSHTRTGGLKAVGVGERFATVTSVTSGSTTTFNLRIWTADAIEFAQVPVSMPSGSLQRFRCIPVYSDTYFSFSNNGPDISYAFGRIDPVGNLRWLSRSPVGDRQHLSHLVMMNNQLFATVLRYLPEGASTNTVTSTGNLVLSIPNFGIGNFDQAGPVSSYGDGFDWSGNFRFSLGLPDMDAFRIASQPDGRWAGLKINDDDSLTFFQYLQAPWVIPDSHYNATYQTTFTPSATAGVLANDLFAQGLAANLVTGPSNGSIAFRTDGTFDYTPNTSFTGVDSFTYRATRMGLTNTTTTNINVRRSGEPYPFSTTNGTVLPFGTTRNLQLQVQRATAPGTISITDNHPNVTVPATVSYPVNATTVTIPVTAASTNSGGTVTITAQFGNFTSTWRMDLVQVNFSGNLSFTRDIRPGVSATGTVTMDRPAPVPISVQLYTDASNLVNIPVVATIPTGATSTTFPVSVRSTARAYTSVQVVAARGVIRSTGVLGVGP